MPEPRPSLEATLPRRGANAVFTGGKRLLPPNHVGERIAWNGRVQTTPAWPPSRKAQGVVVIHGGKHHLALFGTEKFPPTRHRSGQLPGSFNRISPSSRTRQGDSHVRDYPTRRGNTFSMSWGCDQFQSLYLFISCASTIMQSGIPSGFNSCMIWLR